MDYYYNTLEKILTMHAATLTRVEPKFLDLSLGENPVSMMLHRYEDGGTPHDLLDISLKILGTYCNAGAREIFGTAVPHREALPKFNLAYVAENAEHSPIHISHHRISPFCRLWSFKHDGKQHTFDDILIVAPNSGTAVQHMSAPVDAFLPHANVHLVQQIDPHYVYPAHTNELDNSTDALIKVISSLENCHLVGFSQSGIPASVATSWMFQKILNCATRLLPA